MHFLSGILTISYKSITKEETNSVCDLSSNCDGDSELFDQIATIEHEIRNNRIQNYNNDYNDIISYPTLKRTKRSFAPYRTGKIVASQATNTLDNLLIHSDYDKRIRPQV